jgi:hypothetical protein
VPEHPEPVEGTELVEVPRNRWQGFDRLSPNGVGFVFDVFVFPIIQSLSKDRLSPNGVGFVFDVFVFPIILSLSKGRLSPNGEGFVFCLFEFPIILSLSKGRLSPNGLEFVSSSFVFPIILSVVMGQRNPRYETQPVRTEPVEVALPKFATRSLDRLRTDAEVELVMQAIINSPQTPVCSWR